MSSRIGSIASHYTCGLKTSPQCTLPNTKSTTSQNKLFKTSFQQLYSVKMFKKTLEFLGKLSSRCHTNNQCRKFTFLILKLDKKAGNYWVKQCKILKLLIDWFLTIATCEKKTTYKCFWNFWRNKHRLNIWTCSVMGYMTQSTDLQFSEWSKSNTSKGTILIGSWD